jgi:hypothetical protein
MLQEEITLVDQIASHLTKYQPPQLYYRAHSLTNSFDDFFDEGLRIVLQSDHFWYILPLYM